MPEQRARVIRTIQRRWHGFPVDYLANFSRLLKRIWLGGWHHQARCGEFLFQWHISLRVESYYLSSLTIVLRRGHSTTATASLAALSANNCFRDNNAVK
ncbi:hypothetical protein ACVXHA_07245 [Escherichia coli]